MRRKLLAVALCITLGVSTLFTGCGSSKNNSTDVEENESQNSEDSSSDDTDASDNQTDESDKSDSDSSDSDSSDNSESSGASSVSYEQGKSVLTLESDDEFEQFLNDVYILMITQSSIYLHFSVENPEDYGLEAEAGFGETDEEFEEEFYSFLEEKLAGFDYDSLTEEQQLLYDKLSYELVMYNEGEDYGNFYLYALGQNNNTLSNIQTMLTEYSIQSAKDAEEFIEILKLFPDYLTRVEDEMQDELDEGSVITEAMLTASVDFAEDWLSDKAEENVIYLCFENNLSEAGLSDDENEEYLSELAAVIEDSMMPAIEDYEDFLDGLDDYVVAATGLSSFEDGADYYSWLLESYLGSGMTVDELYDYVLDKFNEQMDEVLDISYEHPLAATTYTLATSQYSDDPNEVLEALVELASEEFPSVGDLSWILSSLDDSQKVDSIVAYYMSPQLDNIGRKVIRINDDNVDNSVELFVTMAHEGIPGHLYQDEYDLTDETGYEELDSELTYMSYSEGWAMYVEKLAYGWCIKDENQARIRFLDNIMSYEIVTLADICVNYYGYDQSELGDWLADFGFDDEDTADYIYNFVISDPGIYPCYGAGFLLMEDTIDALVNTGNTEKEAYEKVLTIGAAPYSIIWNKLGIDPLTD